jgi:hypothetical protein
VLWSLSEAQLIALAMFTIGTIALYMTGGVFSGWTREESAPGLATAKVAAGA